MTISRNLELHVTNILKRKRLIRKGIKVPSPKTVDLSRGGVELDLTILYADLAKSSQLSSDFQLRTAAKVMKSFLVCSAKIIRLHKGTITSFDGDRVMAAFIGNTKDTHAVMAGLKINYAVKYIIKPKLESHFISLQESSFKIDHAVGIDTSKTLAVRAGIVGSNDLIWIGRSPNLAAKFSELREDKQNIYISSDVFGNLSDIAKYEKISKELMWDKYTYKWMDQNINIYCSSCTIEP